MFNHDHTVIAGTSFYANIMDIQNLFADKRYEPLILYPGKTSRDVTRYEPKEISPEGKIPLVFVIDGTWKAAKKIMKLSQNLHALPRISILPKEPSRFLIKQQPNILCLSTIESIFFLLAELENKGIESLDGCHKNLMDVLDKMVQIQLTHIHDSKSEGYRKKNGAAERDKIFSKKPHKVSPFFK